MKDYQQIEPVDPKMWAASQNAAKPDPVPAPPKIKTRRNRSGRRRTSGIR